GPFLNQGGHPQQGKGKIEGFDSSKITNTAKNFTLKGDLTIDNGATLDGAASTITLDGNWINNAVFLPGTSELIVAGNLKTISGNNTFNKLTVPGSYTMLNNNTINSLLRITSTGNINGGAGIVTTMNGDLINNGILYTLGTTTFTGNVQQTLSLINAVQTVAVTVNFNGTVPPVLNSTTPPQYGYLNINNTGGVTASVGYTIVNGLSVGLGATFNAGNSTHNIYGYLSNSGTINSSGTINFLPATATNIGMGVDFTSTGRVVFGGAGAIALTGAPVSLRNVTISNTNVAGVTASANWILTNTLTVNAGSLFKAGSNQLSIAGNIDNRGSINSGSSTFIMNGTAPQTIYSASALNNLTVNNENAAVSLLTDVTVNGTLDFVKGNINTGNLKLIQPDAGIIINASQATGWVNGNLKKGIAAAATLRIFQTGDATHYTPVTLNLQSVTTGGNLTVNSIAGDHPALSTSSININKSVNRYWKLLNEGIVFSSVEASFKHPFSDVDASAATATFGAAAYNGATWANKAMVSSNDTITKITSTVLTGDFAFGEICYSNTTIAYGAVYYCTSAPAATPVLTGTAGGTFASHPGLIINPTTGRITPAASAAGEYVVTYSFAATAECSAYTTSTTVFITQAPSASIAYPGGPYCIGQGTAQAVLTGTTGGIFSADNGLHIDPLSGAIDLGNNNEGNYTITYTISAAGGCSAVAYTTNMSIVGPGKWTGTVSTQWYEAGNWLCGIIPSATADVRLDAGAAHYPVIDTGSVTVHNLTVANGASVKVEHARIKVAGVISNLGSIDLSKGTLEFEGVTPQTITANTFVNNAVENLIISNRSDSGLVLAAPLDVYDALTYTTNGKSFITNDFLTLKSTATQTARVGNMNGKTITGNVSVENYISARKAWYFLAVPTNSANTIHQSWQEAAVNAAANPAPGYGTQITGTVSNWQASGFDNYSPGVAIKKYNQVSNNWVGVSTTNATGIKNVDGYMIFIRGDRTVSASTPNATPTVLRTKGPLYTGNLTAVPVPARKTVSVGNPFAAPLDMRKIAKTGVKDFFYVWDPKLGGTYGNGAYQVFSPDSLGNYVVVPGGGSYGANGSVSNYISSGLAFFVEGDSTGGSINFDENAKYDPADAIVSQGGRSKLIVGLVSVAADNSVSSVDGLLVNFDAAYSNKVDKGDAGKYLNAGENIAVLVSNQSLVVERRNLSAATDTIYFKVTNLKAQQYKLNLNASQLDAGGRTGRLIDNFTGSNTALQLNGNTVVDFTVTTAAASYASNRFKIVFDKFSVLPVKFVALKAYSASGSSNNVEWQTAEEVNTRNYEVERSHDGAGFTKIATIAAKGNAGASYSFNDAQPFADVNYYRIKGIENSGQVIYSNIVKVATANKDAELNVFPNPVTDGVTSLQLNNMPKGNYAVSLVAISGQVVYSTTLQNTGRSTTTTLDFGKTIATGIYQLLAVDPNGVKHNREIIIK
ncbi:MAG: T9SS type A sorting domain-containing protein, partial [Sphingobacteriales bacterium]